MRAAVLALLLMALSGCTVLAVTGAVVGTGLAVGGAVVGASVAVVETTYAVGKGAVKVAAYPFRDSDEEKEQKRLKELEEEQQRK